MPLDLLKTEQDRISKRLAFLEAQIEAGATEYEQAQAHMGDCLALAKDCHATYISIDDSLRRIANQAFFDKLYVAEADTVDGESGVPFNIMFNPVVQATALRRQADGELSRTQTGDVGGLNNDDLVGFPGAYSKKSLVAARWRQILELARKSHRKSDPPAPRSRELSRDDTVSILAAAQGHDSISAISRALGIRRGTVRKVLKEHGIQMQDGRRGLSDEAKAEVRSLAADGVPRKKLAEMFGVSLASIGRAIAAASAGAESSQTTPTPASPTSPPRP
ncbi:hypothetical protein [Nesterenkonia massiliensis]|uniref:hypothetical protein n=1 Tax=Nesterenkonia massiliensis TaxID=1232429 RepID=UPI0011CCD220|nr:hypothetical protein [Nesterenkonia massiliensis]